MQLFPINAELKPLVEAIHRVAAAIEEFNFRTYGPRLEEAEPEDDNSGVDYITDESSLAGSVQQLAEDFDERHYPAGETHRLVNAYFDEKR